MKLVAWLALPLVLSSCLTYQLRSPDRSWFREASAVVSQTKGRVTVAATARLEPELRFDVTVTNEGGNDLKLGPQGLRVFSGDDPKAWVAGRVWTAAEVLDREERRVPTLEIVATDAPRPVRTVTKIVRDGQTTYTIDQAPRPATERRVTVVPPLSESRLESLRAQLWTAEVVPRQQTVSGWVFATAPAAEHYKLEVSVGDETFELVFERVAKRVSPLDLRARN